MSEDEQLEYFIKVEPELFINEEMPEAETIVDLKAQLEKALKKAALSDEIILRLESLEKKFPISE